MTREQFLNGNLFNFKHDEILRFRYVTSPVNHCTTNFIEVMTRWHYGEGDQGVYYCNVESIGEKGFSCYRFCFEEVLKMDINFSDLTIVEVSKS